ncbi:hypothetical protein [Mycoplasmopsis gallopavonis]|uniref:Lipoprotein n=1 Tax=Mycoplasmopsis gallopavonis TaxID=76629 RepID=A0A449B0P9_9BACT|nr:hypothetical protein [Mycoplasmopsis gallopavonis]RIV16673.1 hypothetical protein D1113_01480 [Mycoplasmopsis gallopavonis]VEU73313.1 Uncharacterised protein [Mycoplasmopsis gallopavonis]VEU73323.1 Uncharacterised protein [Mycoplasmopsis gallopavonis]VEU73335.1 Uncharacterised protein [Mycoplasmopsis gallopavonis]
MKKSKLLVPLLSAAILPVSGILVACNDNSTASNNDAKYDKILQSTEQILNNINNSELASDLYINSNNELAEITSKYKKAKSNSEKETIIESLEKFSTRLLNDWIKKLSSILGNSEALNAAKDKAKQDAENNLASAKIDLEHVRAANENTISDLELKVAQLERDLKRSVQYNGESLQEEIKELTKDYLPRQLSGKLALLEAQTYLIDWYQAFIDYLQSMNVRDERTRETIASIVQNTEGLKQSTILAKQETEKTPEKYGTRRQFRADLAITMDRIKKIGDRYKNIFNYDVPRSTSKYLEALYKWRIENFRALKAAIEANDSSVYDDFNPNQTGQQTKDGLALTVGEFADLYANSLSRATTYAEQLFSYITLEEKYAKVVLHPQNLDEFSPFLKVRLKMTEYPLYYRLYDSEQTAKLDVYYARTIDSLRDFRRSEGYKYLNSIAYRKVYNQWDKYVQQSINYKYNGNANTYYEILGTFTDVLQGVQELAVPEEQVNAKKAEIEAKIEQVKQSVWSKILTINAKANQEDPDDSFTPYTDLKYNLRAKYSQANGLSQGTFIEAFDKYIAFLLAEKYVDNMIDLYNYWTLVGDDPKSDELEAILKLKTKSAKLEKRYKFAENDFEQNKLNKKFHEENIFPLFKNFSWPNFDSLSDEQQKLSAYKEAVKKLFEIYERIKNISDNFTLQGYDDWSDKDYFFQDAYESTYNQIKQANSELESKNSFSDVDASFINNMKETYEQRKLVVEEEYQAAQENYESKKAAYENSNEFDPRNYVVPSQELYAFIRQWNIKNRAELASLELNPETETDQKAVELFASYSSEWKFGHEDTSTRPYIKITNLDIDDIYNTEQGHDEEGNVIPEYTTDKVKANLLAAEKAYFDANMAYLEAKKANASNLADLKQDLVQKRSDYYSVLNDSHYGFSKSGYAKYTVSHYEKGQQVTLTPLQLASIYASEVATYQVLKELHAEYMDSENN